jgi:hypothetical protein
MDNSEQNLIKKIAQELDCGNDCYYNKKNNEIITISSYFESLDEAEFKEIFQSELAKIEKQKEYLTKFQALEGFQSFKIMEEFVKQLPNKILQLELENILVNKKPFQNFKFIIDQSEFRNNWFEFKQSELEKIVEKQFNK